MDGAISAKSLLKIKLRDDSGKTWKGVTVFPFFDRFGDILKMMVIIPDGAMVYFFNPSDRIYIDGMGRVRLKGLVSTLRPMRVDLGRELRDLWHFDPWWVLTKPEYVNRAWVPAGKATNCPHLFDMVWFDLKLTRIAGVKHSGKLKKFSYELMPEPETRRSDAIPAGPRWRNQWPGWKKRWNFA